MKKIAEDEILSYIEEHLEDKMKPEEIADAFGYSSDHFRHIFRVYYDIPLGEYMRRRRLAKAAHLISEGEQIQKIAPMYGFETPAGFAKAFRKEFGMPASELKNQEEFFLDEIPDPAYDRSIIKVSFLDTSEIKTIGKPLFPGKEQERDLLEEAAYWLDHDFAEIEDREMKKMDTCPGDSISMWYHPAESRELTYLLGPAVKSFSYVPEGMVPVSIPGRRYAIFETKHKSDRKEMAETLRMLFKYIYWEWMPANSLLRDWTGFTFERYRHNKAAVYIPVVRDKS